MTALDSLPDLPTAREDARFAHAWTALDEIDTVSESIFRSRSFGVAAKHDGSPVTSCDTLVERTLTAGIAGRFPRDSILGEELGGGATGSETGLWVIDPIDATANFVDAIPIYAHMVAFQRGGESIFSIISAPMLGKRWWAYRGLGAFERNAKLRVSDTGSLAAARISFGSLHGYPGQSADFLRLVAACKSSRGFGNFFSHMLVAEGSYDLATSGAGCRPWDVVPVELIVREAGGRMSALDDDHWQDHAPFLTSNSLLHQEAITTLAGARGGG